MTGTTVLNGEWGKHAVIRETMDSGKHQKAQQSGHQVSKTFSHIGTVSVPLAITSFD